MEYWKMAKVVIKRDGNMNKKNSFLLLIVVLSAMCLVACGRDEVKVVRQVPKGFIYLEKGDNNWKNGLHYVFWETQISFVDAGRICIYQTSVKNSEFIVQYKGDYYVNEEKLSELMDIAAISIETRHMTYSLEDVVEIRGAGRAVYTVRITALESNKIDSVTTYKINYVVTSNVIENEYASLFAFVETEDGVKYSMFDFIDTETVSIDITQNRKMDAIVFISPDYPGLTYKVVVNE